MYMFEFEYVFDRDDLSYIWQNLAPRNSDKMFFQHSSIAHPLLPTELLTESMLLDHEQLRWMVFKVKQKSNTSYYDLIPAQAGEASPVIPDPTSVTMPGYPVQYNWPYDYLSFVELIKMDVEVLYEPAEGLVGDFDGDGVVSEKERLALEELKEKMADAAAKATEERAGREPSTPVKTDG
tara:strand:- start:400 stop:939 length:540 start_codon:yes stop_codon:yes gene_type:complete